MPGPGSRYGVTRSIGISNVEVLSNYFLSSFYSKEQQKKHEVVPSGYVPFRIKLSRRKAFRRDLLF